MDAQIIDNVSQNMAAALSAAMEQYRDVRIAVAFMSASGLDTIKASLDANLHLGGHIEFLVGLDMVVTEPKALQIVFDYSKTSNVQMYCMASFTPGTIYHPKLYLFKRDDMVMSVIGSSNLTKSGLKSNLEVNVAIQADIQHKMVSDAYDTYNRLKFHQNRVIPDQEFIDLYAKVYQKNRQQKRKVKSDTASIQSTKDLEEKVKSMQRPVPTRRDLFGWLELVYDSLPDDEFTNKEVYVHKNKFKQKYPDNQNIEAKIRQQLQTLRELGFVQHLGKSRWRKL